jgi:hypothetical protein
MIGIGGCKYLASGQISLYLGFVSEEKHCSEFSGYLPANKQVMPIKKTKTLIAFMGPII